MSIPDHARANFETLLRAAADGNLALMECKDAVTSEPRYVICAVGRDGTDFVFTPFGHLADGNPFDAYLPPSEPLPDPSPILIPPLRGLSERGGSRVNGRAVPASSALRCVTREPEPRSVASPSLGTRRRTRCAGFSTSITQVCRRAPSISAAARKWGNPFRIGPDGDRAAVIAKYERWLADQHHLLRALDELRGRDLVCFCAPRACHGDLLLRLANATRDVRIAWWCAVKAAA